MRIHRACKDYISSRPARRISTTTQKKVGVIFLIALLFSSCSIDSNKKVPEGTIDFSTRDDTEIFFKNIRQSYYDLMELKEAKLNIFRWSDSPDISKPTVQLAIIHNWYEDEAFIWIEPKNFGL